MHMCQRMTASADLLYKLALVESNSQKEGKRKDRHSVQIGHASMRPFEYMTRGRRTWRVVLAGPASVGLGRSVRGPVKRRKLVHVSGRRFPDLRLLGSWGAQ